MGVKIDINADMGESYGRWTLGNDVELMPFLSSANVACGYHGGDPHVMRNTVRLLASTASASAPTCRSPTSSASDGGEWTSPPRS